MHWGRAGSPDVITALLDAIAECRQELLFSLDSDGETALHCAANDVDPGCPTVHGQQI